MINVKAWLPILSLGLAGCADGLYYYPDRKAYGFPSQYEDIYFRSADGTRLHAWLVPAKRHPPLGTVIHFHGNAQNLSSHYGFVDWLPDAGFQVFAFDYRGYGQSTGKPDRAGIHDDALAALRLIADRAGQEKLLVIGQSLGAAIAVAALAEESAPEAAAVVLESPFASYRGIARDVLGSVPVLGWLKTPLSYLLVTEQGSPDALIGKLAPTPILIIHGTDDPVVPYTQGWRLYEAAKEPKTFRTIEDGQHTEALTRFGKRYQPLVAEFFKAALSSNGRGEAADSE